MFFNFNKKSIFCALSIFLYSSSSHCAELFRRDAFDSAGGITLRAVAKGRGVTDADLQNELPNVEQQHNIKAVNLEGQGNITDISLQLLQRLPKLKFLNIRDTRISDAAARSFATINSQKNFDERVDFHFTER